MIHSIGVLEAWVRLASPSPGLPQGKLRAPGLRRHAAVEGPFAEDGVPGAQDARARFPSIFLGGDCFDTGRPTGAPCRDW